MSDELDPMWERISAIMGTHTCKEIIEGVWEHTFTPHSYTSTQGAESITADSLLKIAEGIKDQRTQQWSEEYDRYSRASLLRELEELGKPMDMMSYLRYCYDIKIAIPPVGLRPLLAEGTGTRNRKKPWTFTRIANRRKRWLKAYKRAQRLPKKHRAAFRRRKRGLA